MATSTAAQLPQLRRKLTELLARHGEMIVVVELGGNDRLFGVPAGQIQKALLSIGRCVQDIGARLVYMEVIPDGIETDVAKELGVRCATSPRPIWDGIERVRRGTIPRIHPA